MRYHPYLIIAATFVAQLLPLEAAMVDGVCPSADRPGVVAKSRTRSYGGGVQAILPGGVLRLRDGRLGDIKVVITTETRVSRNNGSAATFGDIKVGGRIHGYATIFGDRYVAKVATIE